MSAHTLANSAASVGGCPTELTLQRLLMEGLLACTPASVSILSELGSYFASEDHPSGKDSDGRPDYYLDGQLRWLLEVLVQGRNMGGEKGRGEVVGGREGTHVPLKWKEYLVVDFRFGVMGEATNVQRSPKRMTVFFEQADFSQCSVVCGLGEPEKIVLAK